MPKHGTFAQAIAIQEKYIRPCPEHLTLEEAAALPLGGMTAYRALFSKARINKEDKILITGIGGGVALMALQFALANGNEVCVTSGSSVKLQRAIEMGATIGIDYNSTDWEKAIVKQSGGLFDVIIDSAGGSSFNKLVKCTAPGGRIVVYGGTRGKWTDISPQLLFWRQIAILGTTMSSAEEFDDMLQFVTKNQIRPIVDRVMSLDQGAEALQSMKNSEQFGKIVLLH
jgi:NADPH:quinone reductase-like Zn-dependent oxidoreductase